MAHASPAASRPAPPGDPNHFSAHENTILWLVGAIQFVNILDFMMVMPLGPDFAKALGIPSSHLGYLAASYGLAGFVAGIVGSTFLDRFDRRSALAVSMVGLVLGTLAGGFATGLPSLMAARVVAGAFGGPATSLSISIISDTVPVVRRGKALGRVMGSFAVASVLGVPAGLTLAQLGDWRTPFFAVGGLGFVVALLALLRMPPMRGHLAHAPLARGLAGFEVLTRPEAQVSLLGSFSVLLGNFAIIPLISPYVQYNLHYPREHIDRLYLIGGVASFAALRLAGRWVDRFGSHRVILLGTALYGVVLWVAFLDYQAWLPVMLIFPFFMVASSFRMVSINTLASRVPAAPERARFQSAQSSVQHAGSSLGALLSSYLLTEGPGHELLGIERVAWFSFAIAAYIPAVVWWLHHRLTVRDAAVARDAAGRPG